ncbi:hypothetical protein R6K75_13205, partial [Enterococcus faecium]|nr:hypothetical protein [Enterococcus faecium]
KDQEELIHLISNYSKISLYQHHLTKSPIFLFKDKMLCHLTTEEQQSKKGSSHSFTRNIVF